MAFPVYKLELSLDPLSVTSPTYVDITAYALELSYSRDGGGDLDDPQSGTMQVTLNNSTRRFEPEYAAGAYYPNIKPLRRMRFSIDADVEFTGFVTSWGVGFPAGRSNEEVTVTVVDGWHLAELETLPALDPLDAETYDDVVAFDEPYGHWGMGDPPGTKVRVKNTRKRVKTRDGGHKTVKHKRKFKVTRSEAEAAAGPSGTYKHLPTLGVPGLILGDQDTAVLFASASSQYAKIPLTDESDAIDNNAITLECWFKPTTVSGSYGIIGGPTSSASAGDVFGLANLSGFVQMFVTLTDLSVVTANSNTIMVPGSTYHLVGTWNGSKAIIYINGALDSSTVSGSFPLVTGDVSVFHIGHNDSYGYADGVIDEVAIYEKALSPERVLSHYYAGAQRGWSEQTAGSRIVSILTHDLWGTGSIQTTGLNVQPQMQHGQPLLDETAQTAEPLSVRYFSGAGNPAYLGWDFGDASPYNTVQTTFGDAGGEVPYQSIQLGYDETIYNDVAVANENGGTQTSSDSPSQDEYRVRNYSRTGLILSDDADAAVISDAIVDQFAQPTQIVEGITLHGSNSLALAQIKLREPGQLVRIKARPAGGTAIDRVCRVKSKTVTIPRGEQNRWPVATLTFTRGFNAAAGGWILGLEGFSNLDASTVLT